MPWQREAEFKDALEKAIKKGSKGAIATAQNIALQDMGQCYKHVCALVERQMRKAKANQRLNALYIISTICRHSLKKHKLQDKYTGRWSPRIAALVELVADLPASQMAQVEKVLTSWKREKIFPPGVVDQCAVNAGVTLTQASGLQSLPSGDAGAPMDGMLSLGNNGDANEINIPSPAMSIFSEPSAGSVDLAALEESFPPKTVASANMEAPSKMATPTAMPASNASTGSSRPPDPPKPPPADLYDPFAAESYDYDPSGSDPVPVGRPHALPPLPSLTPPPSSNKQTGAALPAAALDTPTANTHTDRQAPGAAVRAQGNGMAGSSAPPPGPFPAVLPPPSSAQPAPASRKRKSRWEEAGPDGGNDAADLASTGLPAMPAVPAEASRPRRSRFSDTPPSSRNASPQPGQGSALTPLNTHPPPPTTDCPPAQTTNSSMPPKLPQPAPKAVLPPKPASARQDGEAQAAAALQAVEQMLQAKRHSDARNIAPSTSRPRQSPLPAHQPPLPRPPPPQPPLPQMPPPQPAFTDVMEPGTSHAAAAPAWHALHAPHAVHALPANNARPPSPFPGQQPGFPHLPAMLQQQGLPPGMPRPHMRHFSPQQFVQAGLQQHHRPAPLHHLPSMLQNQPRPPPHGRPQPQSPAPQQYRPPPPPPQQHAPLPQPWPQQQSSSGDARQPGLGLADQQLGRPSASPGSRQLPSEADLGRFHTTSVAMDTPTDTGPGFAWNRPPTQGPNRTPGAPPELPAASLEQLRSVQDANQIQIPAEDEAVPGPPPSPPAAPTPPPPPVSRLGAAPSLAPTPASAPASLNPKTLASAGQAQSSVPPPLDPAAHVAAAAAPDAKALADESRLQTPAPNAAAEAEASHASDEATAAVDHASIAPSSEIAHAAAPAGPDEDIHDKHKDSSLAGTVLKSGSTAQVADEEMDMSD